MGNSQDTHRAYVKMRNAQEKVKNGNYPSNQEKAKEAEINYLKAQLEQERDNQRYKSNW